MSEDETVTADTTDQQAKRFKLWFFRDVPEDIRLKLFGLMMYGIATRELETHAAQRSALDFCLSSLGTGFSLQDELKRVNALLTASVDDYNTALEEVKRLREARVKPLEWDDVRNDPVNANSLLGAYRVQHDGDEPDEWSLYLRWRMISQYPSQQSAMAAAQADYTKRILAALTQ